MSNKNQYFKEIHFRSQKEINQSNLNKINRERISREVDQIWNKSCRNLNSSQKDGLWSEEKVEKELVNQIDQMLNKVYAPPNTDSAKLEVANRLTRKFIKKYKEEMHKK
ncbi:hypothetical protein GCM10011351_20690 [Paraliobacillus quinghaiensis]|uniref:Uncharacterized protein n=1 Tax=Paraliobacillus quinghaiensis TaxID=470815 RepID=A0A917TTI6_9BACI|nr:hypothetical protein [Paraliobacillus quinghaiensis]GGM34565.1 hypothetical protein GCM10011351_20690 [Paraliobacillus quinghaiensis]